jgi:hypothetical protein
MGRKEKRALRRLAQARADIVEFGNKLLKFESRPAYAKLMEERGETRKKIFRDLKYAQEREEMNKEILRAEANKESQRNLDLGPDLPYEQPDGSFNGLKFVDERRRSRNRQLKLVKKGQRAKAIQRLRDTMIISGLTEDESNDLIRGRFASAITGMEDQFEAENPPRFPVQITHRMAQENDDKVIQNVYDRYREHGQSEENINAAEEALIYERDVAEPARRRVVQDALGFIKNRIVDADAGIQPTPSIPYGQPILPPPSYVDPTTAAFAAARALPRRPPMSEQEMIDRGFAQTRAQARDIYAHQREVRRAFEDEFYDEEGNAMTDHLDMFTYQDLGAL